MTVVVLPVQEQREYRLRDADLKVFTKLASGAGGQHVNKTESAVVIRHLPTGIEAQSATKSQTRNRDMARMVLEARVAAHFRDRDQSARDATRRQQAGSGMRGDKLRTYREIDDRVLDDRSGKKASLKRVLERGLQVIWQ